MARNELQSSSYDYRKIRGHNYKERSLPFIGDETFALDAIDRCVDAFDNHITDVKIITDNMSIDDAVEKIAELANLQLSLGRLSQPKK